MQDDNLFFARNDRPALIPGGTFPAFFPSSLAPAYWDLQAAMDMARGRSIFANFRIATSFNSVAANLLRFAVFVDDNEAFVNVLTNPSLIIARSHDFLSGGLVAGTLVSVAIPPMSDITRVAGDGLRFITLGLEATVPTTDWSQGGVDAFLTHEAFPSRPLATPAGY